MDFNFKKCPYEISDRSGTTVVCMLTGNGSKDPDCAVSHSGNQVKSGIKPQIAEVAKAMGF